MLVLLVPIAGIVPWLGANIWLPVGVFDTHGARQGSDVELVPWTWAEPEAPLEESSTLLRGKSNPEVSNIHQTSRGKGQSRPGHSSSLSGQAGEENSLTGTAHCPCSFSSRSWG